MQRGSCRQGIGRCRGGLTSKILAFADALGRLVRLAIIPGQAHDLACVPQLLKDLPFELLIGAKTFDADLFLGELEGRGAEAVILSRKNRTDRRDHERETCKRRHQIGNLSA